MIAKPIESFRRTGSLACPFVSGQAFDNGRFGVPRDRQGCLSYGKSNRRSAFTLLEVVLAVSISLVLVTALYLALSMNFRFVRTGHEVLDETTVVRGVLTRITNDINGNLGPINPLYYQSALNSLNNNSSSGSGSSGSSNSSSSSSGSSSSSSGSSSSGSSSNSSSSNNSNSNPQVPAYLFNLGVRGDNTSFVLTVSKTPGELAKYIGQSEAPPASDGPVSDLRRITYWVIPGEGLARLEETNVTQADSTTITAPPTDTGTYNIIAPEVESMQVDYFGTSSASYQSSWDGTTLDATTSLPYGPPAAIRIKLKMKMPPSSKNDEGRQVTIQHVVAIQAANRWITAQTGQGSGP